MASVHRFHEFVGLSIGGAPATRYLDAKNARRLAAALYRVARSIEREPFTSSHVGTMTADDWSLDHAFTVEAERDAARELRRAARRKNLDARRIAKLTTPLSILGGTHDD